MFIITATQHGQAKYYCAFNLMVNPPVLQTTPNIESAFECKTMEKAQEGKTWLEGKFSEYQYQIQSNE